MSHPLTLVLFCAFIALVLVAIFCISRWSTKQAQIDFLQEDEIVEDNINYTNY